MRGPALFFAFTIVAFPAVLAVKINVTTANNENVEAEIGRSELLSLWTSMQEEAGTKPNSGIDAARFIDATRDFAEAIKYNKKASDLARDLDTFWLIFGGILVFFMQPGFALLEAGSVRSKNTKNILFKNVCDACVGALGFWSLGYGFAYGSGNAFVGTQEAGWFSTGEKFLGTKDDEYNGKEYAGWFFQFAFAATAATIVSGAVAERISFSAYLIGTTFITVWVYPVVVHWGWSGSGWASAFREDGDKLLDVGATDFAGCAVVHMVGGISALSALFVVGPRIGRFDAQGVPQPIVQQSPLLQIFGTFILWFGWYGFNCVSTLQLSGGYAGIAGKTAVTTTLAPAAACIVSVLYSRVMNGILDCGAALNGILAGLVSITSACSTCEPWAAVVIGMIGALVYQGCSKLMLDVLKLDDVVDAVAVHAGCGAWGCIAAALFATKRNYGIAYTTDHGQYGLFYGGGAKLLGANVLFILAVVAWVGVFTYLIFAALKATIGVRVSPEVEQAGMDVSKHGGVAFGNDGVMTNGMHMMVIKEDLNKAEKTAAANC
jgi:Amt family ammonium transporter